MGKALLLKDISGMSIPEAIEAVHPWLLVKVPLQGILPDGEVLEAPETYGIYRTDNKYLGHVGERQEIVQPINDFMRYQEAIDGGVIRLTRAGTISNGRSLIIQAEFCGHETEIGRGDSVKHGLTMYTGLAGNKTKGFSSFGGRLCCSNQLAWLKSQEGLRLKHTKGIHDKLDNFFDCIVKEGESFQASIEAYRSIARKPIKSEKQIQTYVDAVFEVDRTEEVSTKLDNKVRYVTSLFDTQIGGELVEASYWKAYNAVTQYLTHDHGHNEDNRLDSLLFGESARVSQRALSLALNA